MKTKNEKIILDTNVIVSLAVARKTVGYHSFLTSDLYIFSSRSRE